MTSKAATSCDTQEGTIGTSCWVQMNYEANVRHICSNSKRKMPRNANDYDPW